jgi:hypothetical protein
MNIAHEQAVENIIAFWRRATADERANGGAWYVAAREAAENIARRNNIAVETAIAVVSVLSPQMEWNANLRWAAEVVEAWKRGDTLPRRGLGNSLVRAARALAGNRDDIMREKGTLKVHNFYLSIRGVPGAICVDRHAIRVVMGDSTATPPSLTDKRYRAAAAAYQEAARRMRVRASTMQAVTWVVCKRERAMLGLA